MSIDNVKKSKLGRPSVDTEAVTVRLPRDMLEAIEAYRREQETIPSRPEAIRQMLSDWLASKGFMPKT
jgi:Arc/MetJ-type ribon-helix-helix transcriptional regulator